MLYVVSPCSLPLRHISSGHLVNSSGFVHPDRIIDTFVLIVMLEGVLFIEQDGEEHRLAPEQFMVLHPMRYHRGYRSSEGRLSYYWCHFQIQGDNYTLGDPEMVNRQLFLMKRDRNTMSDYYVLPEVGMLRRSERATMLFRQLLDIVEHKCYSDYLANYALSMLSMQISSDFIDAYDAKTTHSTYRSIAEIMEWIRVNYAGELSVQSVAKQFNYNPNYLSNAFKKYAGVPMITYINRTKVSAAKKRLLTTSEPVRNIASAVGFRDEKHFMKTFKRQEGITPTQYRNAFYRKHMNLQ